MTAELLAQNLLQLGLTVRRQLIHVMHAGGDDLARPVERVGGDMIYELDRHVEPVIEREIAGWPDDWKPLLLIAEGLNDSGRKRFGREADPLRYRLLVDPIDGTRGLMYDKRSAWFAAAIVPDAGEATRLDQSVAAALVELPTTKQAWADAWVAVRDRPTWGQRASLDGTRVQELTPSPSRADTLRDGFGHIVSFFPGTKVLAAELLERIALVTLGRGEPGEAQVFDDQYISTSGQLVELIVGHDRFCGDLRPILQAIARPAGEPADQGLACHSYDMAGWLVAQQAGVILTDGFGGPLQLPLDVHHPVHWCGYANASLQAKIQPVIRDWLSQRGRKEHDR
jgi:hypothetical protein